MKKIQLIITAALLLILAAGCNKFLDRQPITSMSNQLALSNYNNILTAVNGTYSYLYSSDYYGRDFMVYAEIKSSNAKKSKDHNSGRFDTEYNWANNDANTSSLLLTGFQVVTATDNIIDALEGFTEVGITEEQINQLKGEALFLRALAYFDMARIYCQPYTYSQNGLGLPIIEHTVISLPARNTVKETYDFIVKDLLAAESLIGDPNRGNAKAAFASKESVQALLAKVYLYMGEWQNAADYATKVINSAKYTLYTTANYQSSFIDDNPTEVIFMVYGDKTQATWPGYDEIGYIYNPTGYGDVCATDDLLSLFEAGDIRLTMFSSYGSATEKWTLKYAGKGQINVNNIPVLRLSEMYLIRAEAKINLTQNALSDYNEIRTHRGLSSATSVTLADIYKERRRELCFEGNAEWDLSRTGQGLSRPASDVWGNAPATISFPDYRWAMPIPLHQIEVDSNFVQNPGY